jgi:hypothetical protein
MWQANAPDHYRRSYMGEVYGIITGVEQGLGRAVMSRHLLRGNPKIKILKGYKRYFQQPYYSRLHAEVVRQFERHCPELLESKGRKV